LSGIEKIAKNNDLSKIKNDYWGLAPATYQ